MPRDTHHVAIGGQVETTDRPQSRKYAVVEFRSASRTSSAAERAVELHLFHVGRRSRSHRIGSRCNSGFSICRRRRPMASTTRLSMSGLRGLVPPVVISTTRTAMISRSFEITPPSWRWIARYPPPPGRAHAGSEARRHGERTYAGRWLRIAGLPIFSRPALSIA